MVHLDLEQLKALAQAADSERGCLACQVLRAPGWASVPSDFDTGRLRLLGTLRAPPSSPGAADEPTWEEYHPQGTRTDSATAPIAPAFYPYNRSDLAACRTCSKLFLRYTEAGGYYVDPRIRELNPALLV